MVMLATLMQPKNAKWPIVVTLAGMVMPVRFSQWANVSGPMDVKPAGSVMLPVRLRHPLNALAPRVFKLAGMVTLVSKLQLQNASFSIVVTLAGSVMLVIPQL
jgi:hypothetical protein